jgi:hypothetical protein
MSGGTEIKSFGSSIPTSTEALILKFPYVFKSRISPTATAPDAAKQTSPLSCYSRVGWRVFVRWRRWPPSDFWTITL